MTMTSRYSTRLYRHFFQRCFLALVKFSYCSKFHINIISGSGVMTTFFYKGLTRNPEIGNTPVWGLSNIWRLGRVRDTKFGTNLSNKMLANATKWQGYSFYHFWVIKGKSTGCGEGGWNYLSPPAPHIHTHPHTQIRVKGSISLLTY